MATMAPAAQPGNYSRQQAVAVAELSGITKRYGETVALDELSLSLGAGEIVALLGPNGAGKSTAVRLMLGLTSPTSGTARVFGRDPRDASTRTRIGAMLQVGNAPEVLKVREHIDLFRSYYPRPLAVEELVRIAGLESILDKKFGDLSGGQKQRTLFALALVGDPDVIFLDEPTVGLDIEARRALWVEVRARRPREDCVADHALSRRGRRAGDPGDRDRQGPGAAPGYAIGD